MLLELRGASERWFQAWLEKDAAIVERLAAADYVYIARSALMMDREPILKIIRCTRRRA
jgi:hypothetical protein